MSLDPEKQIGALIRELLPGFFKEISRSLDVQRRPGLFEQLPDLTIKRWTWDPSCVAMWFEVGGVRKLNIVEENVIGVKYEGSIALDDCDGTVVIDVDNFGRVKGIEIIGRRDLYEVLSKADVPMEKLE